MAAAPKTREITVYKKPAVARQKAGVGGLVAAGGAAAALSVFIGAILIRLGIAPLWASLLTGATGVATAIFGRKDPHLVAAGIGTVGISAANLAAVGLGRLTGPAPVHNPAAATPAAPAAAARQAAVDAQQAAAIAANVRDDYWRAVYAQQTQQGAQWQHAGAW